MKEFLHLLLIYRFEAAAVLLFGIGFINLLLQKNLLKKVLAFNIMDSSVFMFLGAQGYIEGRTAPISSAAGAAATEMVVNPIPAGLVLTGIVVSVSVSAFLLALVQRLYKKYHTLDFDEIMLLAKKEAE